MAATAAYTIECPVPDCDGTLEFVEETSETYTAHGLACWSQTYLVLNGTACTDGHEFDDERIRELEKYAMEAAQDGSWLDP